MLGADQSSKKLFRVDFKLEIPTYDGVVDADKLDNWIEQMKNYFTLYVYTSAQKISFARLKMSGHTLTWWNAYVKHHDISGLTWSKFKKLVRK